LIYLKTSIKNGHKEKLMVRIKRGLKFRWILCFVIFSLVLLIYGNHLFKERAKKLEDMRRTEAFEFMDDGWKKYRMMQYAGANMEYTDSKGNIKVIETEPVLLDIFDEAIDPYILGKTPSLGSFRITEGEETSEHINSFEELWEYMNKRNDEGVIYINELDIVGYDRTDRDGKFIYDYGNGESKEISENVISLLYLFRKKYKDKL